MRAASRVGAAVALAGFALAACGGPLADYDDARDEWTRSQETYESFESRLFIDATLKTGPFIERYVDAYARIFDLTEAQRAALADSEYQEARTGWTVVAAVFTHDPDWDDLDPDAGIWSIYLENAAGERLQVGEVDELDDDNPTWVRLFPYVGYHDTLYELRFPRPEGTSFAGPGDRIALVITGAPARVRLEWTLPRAVP